MGKFHTIGVVGLAAGIAGCSTFPQPKDVIGSGATIAIVKSIRCEAKEALSLRVVDLFLKSEDGKTKEKGVELLNLYNAGKINKFYNEIKILEGKIEIQDTDTDKTDYEYIYDQTVVKRIEIIGNTGITYTFTFEITESNDNNASATFTLPYLARTFTLGLSTGNELERKGLRKFTLTENFIDYQKLSCPDPDGTDKIPEEPAQKDWVYPFSGSNFYPISGRIGVKDVLSTFIGLVNVAHPTQVLLDEFDPEKPEINFDPEKLDSYSDTITFTSLIKGSITPSITLVPPGFRNFKLATAKITSSVDRTDLHEVQISLNLPGPVKSKPETEEKGMVDLGNGFTLVLKGAKSEEEKESEQKITPGLFDIRNYSAEQLEAGRRGAIRESDRLQALDILQRELEERRN